MASMESIWFLTNQNLGRSRCHSFIRALPCVSTTSPAGFFPTFAEEMFVYCILADLEDKVRLL